MFIFQCPIFLPFHSALRVLKARILKQFAVPSPGDHVLSEHPTMTCPSWVALHSMAQSFFLYIYVCVYVCVCVCVYVFIHFWASLVAQTVENLPATQEIRVWSPGQEDSLEKGMAAYSSILAWRIPWIEEPGELLFMRFSKQEYWNGLPVPSSVDHILSELSIMTHMSRYMAWLVVSLRFRQGCGPCNQFG